MPRQSRSNKCFSPNRTNHLFPGPKMKPRPPDFDEELVRRAPTFIKWLSLKNGDPLTYACRTFVKGHADDEERLMRRIMIARRNNLKDHAVLKKARAMEAEKVRQEEEAAAEQRKRSAPEINQEEKNEEELLTESLEATYATTNPSGTKRRFIPGKLRPSDAEILDEMDIPAVEATRSYRKWLTLHPGQKLMYNQEYTKGDPEQDWLLRKSIWRRMRYRRENQLKVRELQSHEIQEAHETAMGQTITSVQSVVDAAAAAAAAAHGSYSAEFDAAAVAALDAGTVNDPLVTSALLAAVVIPQDCGLMGGGAKSGDEETELMGGEIQAAIEVQQHVALTDAQDMGDDEQQNLNEVAQDADDEQQHDLSSEDIQKSDDPQQNKSMNGEVQDTNVVIV